MEALEKGRVALWEPTFPRITFSRVYYEVRPPRSSPPAEKSLHRGTFYCRNHFWQKVNKEDEPRLMNQCVVLGLNSTFTFEYLDVVRVGNNLI
jgi:hypothetical protein